MAIMKKMSTNFLGVQPTPKYTHMTSIDAILKQIYNDNPYLVSQFIKSNLEAMLLDRTVTVEEPSSYTNVKFKLTVVKKKGLKNVTSINTEQFNQYMAAALMDTFKVLEDESRLFSSSIDKIISRAPANMTSLWEEVLEEFRKLKDDKAGCMMLFKVQNYTNLNTIIIELGQ